MKTALLTLILLAGGIGGLRAAVTLETAHADISVNYNSTLKQFQLTVRDEDATTEFSSGRAYLSAGIEARLTVPDDSSYAFLGQPGDSLWVLPQTQDEQLLFLGISTENKTSSIALDDWEGDGVTSDFLVRGIPSGIFSGNQITLALKAVTGPGFFSVYSTGVGGPTIVYNTRDGITSADQRNFTGNRHSHFNWAFSQPGVYSVTFEASGTLSANGQTVTSAPTAFTFVVVPEPGGAALLMTGSVLALAAHRGRRRMPRHTTSL